MRVRVPYQVLFLVFVVLGLYYTALFAGFNSVDDLKMVNWIENHPLGSVWEVFRPGGRFYYRPLLRLSFIADNYLWGMQPGFMHLGNILIHAVNSVLVFFLARRAFTAAGIDNRMPAWFAGLVFALHPIQTESVNWISGRTDPLATLFVLAAMLALIYALEKGRVVVALGAAILFLAGVMSKEMSLFALPVTLFILWRWPLAGLDNNVVWRSRLVLSGLFAGPFALVGGVYLAVRMARFSAGDPAIHYVLEHFRYGPFDTVRVFFKAFGFYVKKLFLPLPLNFAIVGANDNYVWLGLLVLVVTIVVLLRRWLMADFLLAAFFLILPALIIALTNVAWTPLAERYLYLPCAFWSIGFVGGGFQLLKNFGLKTLAAPVAGVIVLTFGWLTLERNVVWQSNLTLFQDTVNKSPSYLPARNDLAVALMADGRFSEAREQLKIAQSKAPERKSANVYYNEVHALLGEEKYQEAESALNKLLEAEDNPSLKFLQDLARAYEVLLLKLPEGERILILDQLGNLYQQIYRQTSDPFIRYRQAQIAMFQGEKQTAGRYFAEAYRRAPESSHYKKAAGILARKMTGGETD